MKSSPRQAQNNLVAAPAMPSPIYRFLDGKKTKCHALHCQCPGLCGDFLIRPASG